MVPKCITFVYLFGNNTIDFNINHYISIKSNIIVNRLQTVNLYTNNALKLYSSFWYQNLIKEFDSVIKVSVISLKSELPCKWSDDIYMAHASDMIRLKYLIKTGGIYSDVDSIAVNPIPSELFYACNPVFSDETNDGGLCNGFFLTPPDSEFLKAWYLRWEDYDPKDCKPRTDNWTKYSVQLGKTLSYQFEVGYMKSELIQPYYLSYTDVENLFFINDLKNINRIKPYQIHLWETRNQGILKVFDEDYFMKSNATYAQIGRRYL